MADGGTHDEPPPDGSPLDLQPEWSQQATNAAKATDAAEQMLEVTQVHHNTLAQGPKAIQPKLDFAWFSDVCNSARTGR